MNTGQCYENRACNATKKGKQEPYLIYKDGATFSRVKHESAYSVADLVSTATKVEVNGKEIWFEIQRLTLDCDAKLSCSELKEVKTGRSYNPSSKRVELQSKIVLSPTLVRKAIEKSYLPLAKYFTFISRSRNDGLSLSIYFPSFEVGDALISRIATNVQARIGSMLEAIGIGVDKSAYGLIRDVPNENNPKYQAYRNKKKGYSKKSIIRKDNGDYPIKRVLSDLIKLTDLYKPVWDDSKRANPDKYLYGHAPIEKKLALLWKSGFTAEEFSTQQAAADFLGISAPTFRLWLKEKGPDCLSIDQTFKGYLITLRLSEAQQKRARVVLSGVDLDQWKFPHPRDVVDGIRNKYIYRCAVTLKLSGYSEYRALELMIELVKMIPGHESSQNCKSVGKIVACIFRSRPYQPGKYGELKPILGLDEAFLAVEKKSRNLLSGDSGEIKKEGNRVKSIKQIPFDLNQVEPTLFIVTQRVDRQTENLIDKDQKKIHRMALDHLVKPKILPILSQNCFGYVDGISKTHCNNKNEQLSHVFNHSVEFDIQKFFPSIDQTILKEKMIQTLGHETAEVIHAAVTADQIIDGQTQKRTIGIATGSTLSPILSNLYLNDFDHWLSKKGVAFTRYVDNMKIFAHSRSALNLLFEEIQIFLQENLKLKLNPKKTVFMGYGNAC